jgi:hypothetical protein
MKKIKRRKEEIWEKKANLNPKYSLNLKQKQEKK